MRILLINSVYQEGSTGKIVASLAKTLRRNGHDVFTCYGLGKISVDKYSEKICTKGEHLINTIMSRFTGIPYGGIFFSNIRIKKIIRQFCPDIVHIHCINGSMINVYSLLKFLANNNIKTVLTLHAEIFHTAGCEHAYDCNKWKTGCSDCPYYKERVHSWLFDRSKASYKKNYDAINSFRTDNLIITAVSPWLAKRAKQSAIMKRFTIKYVPNGVDTSIFHYISSTNILNKNDYKKIILYVTPYFSIDENSVKGGVHLLDIARRVPNYKFILVAGRINSVLPNLPNNIQIWGRASSSEQLARLYSEADLTLLLSKRETFSMVTVESLCCGTPVVGFNAGGPESIAIPKYTKFVEYGNIDELIQAMSLSWDIDKNEISAHSRTMYTENVMSKLFYDLYVNL